MTNLELAMEAERAHIRQVVESLELCFVCGCVTEQWVQVKFAGRLEPLCRQCIERNTMFPQRRSA